MTLHPCGECGRHVDSSASECPFCSARIVGVVVGEPRARTAGRVARALMFAGALAGCDQGKGAAAGKDKPVAKEPIRVPRVHGTITDETSTPLVGANVVLSSGTKIYRALTDHRGRFAFEEVAAAPSYTLRINHDASNERGEWGHGQAEREVGTITDGSDVRVDVSVTMNWQPPAMPYGAPPARRRVV